MYKQCKLINGNIYTYNWINEKLAKEGDLINYKNDLWRIDKVWHQKEMKRLLADVHILG